MTRGITTERPDPWRVPVNVEQMPDTGLHRDIEADAAARQAIAEVGQLRAVFSVQPARCDAAERRRAFMSWAR